MIDRRKIELFPSKRIQSGVAGNGEAFDVSMLKSGIFIINLSAQGTYTDETLDVKLQTKDPISGSWIDLYSGATQMKFTQIGDKTAVVPFTERVECPALYDFIIRVYYIAAGTTEDFTFSVTALFKE